MSRKSSYSYLAIQPDFVDMEYICRVKTSNCEVRNLNICQNVFLLVEVLSYLCYNVIIINKGLSVGKKIDMLGKVFGRLTVVSEAPKVGRQYLWHCDCECGGAVVAFGGNLRKGQTQSCGCLRSEQLLTALTTHGMTDTPTYKAWAGMRTRCYTKGPDYKDYGARGVLVCDAWLNSFEAFYKDMGFKPDNCSIDRIDNDGNYEPSNCRWATLEEQAQNKRNTVLTPDLVRMIRSSDRSGAELAREIGTSKEVVNNARQRRTWKNII